MLDIPEEMKKYVNDYKMLLVEAGRNDLVLHHTDNVDLFNLLKIILDRSLPGHEAKKKAIQYSEEHRTGRAVIMTVAGATNSRLDYDAFEKGDGSMCTLFEEIARENEIKFREKGREEGRAAEIIESGYEFGLSEDNILERLQKSWMCLCRRPGNIWGDSGSSRQVECACALFHGKVCPVIIVIHWT